MAVSYTHLDVYKRQSDDGQYLKRSSTDQGYEDTAFSLEIGQTSGLVETVNGIFILKRYEPVSYTHLDVYKRQVV